MCSGTWIPRSRKHARTPNDIWSAVVAMAVMPCAAASESSAAQPSYPPSRVGSAEWTTSWDTAHMAVTDVGTQLLIDHPGRLDGVEVVGVDEHAWRHTRKGDKYVTVIIDLTPIRDDTGPARLLDLVEGRSKKAFKTWLEAQTDQFRARVAIVAMDGFTGFKTAAAEAVP